MGEVQKEKRRDSDEEAVVEPALWWGEAEEVAVI